MKKSFMALLVILSFVLFSNPMLTFAEGTSIELDTTQNLHTLKPGDIFTVNVIVKNVTNLVGGELTITYDTSLLTLRGKALENNDMIDFAALEVSNESLADEPGKAKFIFGLDKAVPPLTGNHVIATLNFEALSKGNGSLFVDNSSTLISEDTKGFLDKIEFSTNQIDYTILGIGNISGIIRNKSNEAVANATINLIKDDNIVYSASSGVDGSYRLTDVVEGQYILKVEHEGYKVYSLNVNIIDNGNIEINVDLIVGTVGDVNDDGRISLEDLVFVANYYGLSINDIEWNENASIADINKDNRVDILDLVFISRKLEL